MTISDKRTLAGIIDHTKLHACSTQKEIATLCLEAREHSFHSVCVNGYFARFVTEQLTGSDVLVCCVVGFPLGANTSSAKAHEAQDAINNGASEIDMVINIGALRDKKNAVVLDDIRNVVAASANKTVKVILETCYLTDDEIIRACNLSVEAGAHFVKTSTGFGAFGAIPNHVQLMRRSVGPDIGVKASGGIRTIYDAWRMVQAGANRLGTSASVGIIECLDNLIDLQDIPQNDHPCRFCPSFLVSKSKLPKEIYDYHINKCPHCPHLENRKHLELLKES